MKSGLRLYDLRQFRTLHHGPGGAGRGGTEVGESAVIWFLERNMRIDITSEEIDG